MKRRRKETPRRPVHGNVIRVIRRSAIAAVVAALALPAAAETGGRVRVIEGDVLDVAGQRYRLFGIDAPEPGQNCLWPNKVIACGRVAATALMDLVTGARVRCRARGRDEDGRLLGVCDADGFDIGENMVHTGWALALPGRSGRYAATQTKAQKAQRGLWRGVFTAPWQWRRVKDGTDRGNPAGGVPSCIAGRMEAAGAECPGFRGADGRLYSLPGLLGAASPAGAAACLCGRRAEVSVCTRGTAFAVATIGPPETCR